MPKDDFSFKKIAEAADKEISNPLTADDYKAIENKFIDQLNNAGVALEDGINKLLSSIENQKSFLQNPEATGTTNLTRFLRHLATNHRDWKIFSEKECSDAFIKSAGTEIALQCYHQYSKQAIATKAKEVASNLLSARMSPPQAPAPAPQAPAPAPAPQEAKVQTKQSMTCQIL